MASRLRDRRQAGRELARHLEHLRAEQPVVVGLPRGGVPVAAEVAAALDAPLDVILVRKLGVPFQPELAMGAIGEDGVRVLDDHLLAATGITADQVARVERRERAELDRRAATYRACRPRVPLAGRTVVIVDDGLATGATARAAVQVARQLGARRVVVAVPVGSQEAYEMLASEADQVICAQRPPAFTAVGAYYDDFHEVSDDEVTEALADTA